MKIIGTLLVLGGITAFIYGLLTVLGIVKTNIDSKDSGGRKMDEKLLKLPDKTRYQVGRYLGGSQLIGVGIALFVFGLIALN